MNVTYVLSVELSILARHPDETVTIEIFPFQESKMAVGGHLGYTEMAKTLQPTDAVFSYTEAAGNITQT